MEKGYLIYLAIWLSVGLIPGATSLNHILEDKFTSPELSQIVPAELFKHRSLFSDNIHRSESSAGHQTNRCSVGKYDDQKSQTSDLGTPRTHEQIWEPVERAPKSNKVSD